jgi:O-antigen ligase
LPFVVAVVWEMWKSHGELLKLRTGVPNFANVRHFGQVCFLASACGIGAMFLSRRFMPVRFTLACLPLFALLLVGSRGPALAWLACAGFLCVAKGRGTPGFVWQATCVAGVACIAVWLLDLSGVLPSPNVFSRVGRFVGGTESLDSGRMEIWGDSLREFIAHPWLGSGPEGYELSGSLFSSCSSLESLAVD